MSRRRRTTKSILYVAVEVSAHELVVRTERHGHRRPISRWPNTPDGHQSLVRSLGRHRGPVRAILESTGVYGLDVAVAFVEAGFEVSAPNPARVRHFARAEGEAHKTDLRDVDVLLKFLQRMDFEPWTPPSAVRLALRSLVRRILQVQELITQEKNRLHSLRVIQNTPRAVLEATEQMIEYAEATVARLYEDALALVKQDPWLEQSYELLLTIKGVGPRTALKLLGEFATFPHRLTAKQWVRMVGFFPRQHQSGKTVKRLGISKQGNKYVRAALFLPALSAARHVAPLREFVERLEARGLKPIQARLAVMRRLIVVMHAMLRDRTPFEEHRLYPRHRQNKEVMACSAA